MNITDCTQKVSELAEKFRTIRREAFEEKIRQDEQEKLRAEKKAKRAEREAISTELKFLYTEVMKNLAENLAENSYKQEISVFLQFIPYTINYIEEVASQVEEKWVGKNFHGCTLEHVSFSASYSEPYQDNDDFSFTFTLRENNTGPVLDPSRDCVYVEDTNCVEDDCVEDADPENVESNAESEAEVKTLQEKVSQLCISLKQSRQQAIEEKARRDEEKRLLVASEMKNIHIEVLQTLLRMENLLLIRAKNFLDRDSIVVKLDRKREISDSVYTEIFDLYKKKFQQEYHKITGFCLYKTVVYDIELQFWFNMP